MSTREERALARRATWAGEVVAAGTPKPLLYRELSLVERMRALSALNERAWCSSGRSMPPPLPRSEWPGEVFEI